MRTLLAALTLASSTVRAQDVGGRVVFAAATLLAPSLDASSTPLSQGSSASLSSGARGNPASCGDDFDCTAGYRCSAQQCRRRGEPEVTLAGQGVALHVRVRAIELREEVGLGRGPIIRGLATRSGVSEKSLGRALREHRAELLALIGDGREASWPARFLTRMDELCPRT